MKKLIFPTETETTYVDVSYKVFRYLLSSVDYVYLF